jgi:hypothetical protein
MKSDYGTVYRYWLTQENADFVRCLTRHVLCSAADGAHAA